jgi:tetraacyldisaccharide 4'-kinase
VSAEQEPGAPTEPRWQRRLAAAGEQFATFVVDVIYDRRRDFAARLAGAGLWLLSLIFTALSVLRYHLYEWRILRAQHLGCMVIVVGNLTVGGTGKTPVVERLARSLHDRGRKVAILSRGYKSRSEPAFSKFWRWITHTAPQPPRVVSDGQSVLLDSLTAGDEPYMLARNLPGIPVITDKDRVKAGRYAIRKFGADTLILDDGFQYFQLQDHFQLLLVDKTNPFGNGHLLPRGILREPVRHLRRASWVFLTKSDGTPDPELEERIRRLRPGTEFIECTHRPQYLQEVNGSTTFPLNWLEGRRVAALSGIATPETFEEFLHKLGAAHIQRHRFLDHHRYSGDELARVARACELSRLDCIVTTEKDAVRIAPSFRPAIPFLFLRVEIKILSGARDFEEAVTRICLPRRTTRLPDSAG